MRNEINLVVRNTREVCGCSRKKVTQGICEEQILYNLESKNKIPDIEILEAITSRLGLEDEVCDVYLSFDELDERKLKHDMNRYAYLQEREKVVWCLGNLKSKRSKNSVLRKQLYYLCLGILYKGSNFKKSYGYLTKAIRITKPNYPKIDYWDELLNKREIEILLEIAAIKNMEKKHKESYIILNGLKHYFNVRERYRAYGADKYAAIIKQISNILIEIKEYEQVVIACEEGMNVLSEFDKGDYVEDILLLQIKAMKEAKYPQEKIEILENIRKCFIKIKDEISYDGV